MNKSVKGFENAGKVERPAKRREVVTKKRQWPDMETPVLRPHPVVTFKLDLGRNATPIRQPREFIWAEKSGNYSLDWPLRHAPWIKEPAELMAAELDRLNGLSRSENNLSIVISRDEEQRRAYIEQGVLGDGFESGLVPLGYPRGAI